MGKVVEQIEVVNWGDIEMIAGGARKAAPRSLKAEALVDTGAGLFYLQTSLIKKLGLRAIDTVRSRTMSNLLEERRVWSPVELRLAGRTGVFRVVETPDALPNLIGQIPLEELDFVVDLRKRKVVPNPDHPDGPLYDEFQGDWGTGLVIRCANDQPRPPIFRKVDNPPMLFVFTLDGKAELPWRLRRRQRRAAAARQ